MPLSLTPSPQPTLKQLATSKGFDLSVNLHVDDATKGGLGGWRNTLLFSPVQPYSGLRWASETGWVGGVVGGCVGVWMW